MKTNSPLKSTEELRAFYQRRLVPELEKIEAQRKSIIHQCIYWYVMILILSVVVLVVVPSSDELGFLKLVFYGVLAGLGFVTAKISNNYVPDYKERVIKQIITFIYPRLVYQPEGLVRQEEFEASGIFPEGISWYHGEDLVHGKLGATKIKFSEVQALEIVDRDSKRMVFHGLFFIADFNKHFKGRTVVVPDKAEVEFGRLGRLFQKMNPNRDDLVLLEDPEFERMFAVYGTDQVEARYVLSPALMERIKNYRKKSNRKIHLAFAQSNIYVAISCHQSLFEPKLFTSVLKFEPIQEYFEELQLAIGIVEDLDLNTRIWSKA